MNAFSFVVAQAIDIDFAHAVEVAGKRDGSATVGFYIWERHTQSAERVWADALEETRADLSVPQCCQT